MHYRMLVTISLPLDAASEDVRRAVRHELLEDDSFCGSGGRFGSPLCDWFVIGGRWSGLLAEVAIGERYYAAVQERFPTLAAEWWPQSYAEEHGAELDALWKLHGGTDASPYTRSHYQELGYTDDALLVSPELYDALLAEFVGESNCEGYVDLNGDPLERHCIGRKWLVVIDCHS